MNTLLKSTIIITLSSRIDQLTPYSPRQWGKMNVDQILAHCTAALRVANNEAHPPHIFIGRIVAPFVRKKFFE